ncbi:MAG: BON domain-containing protein, partial [Alphaproteobacteria bacterium]|nr:BON domain-containing protein [Alphaproteobacteria bacterium]
MNKKSILALSLSMLVLSNCVAPLIVGGGAAVGTMAIKDKGISGTMNDSSINAAIDAKLYQKSSEVFTQVDVDVYMSEVLLTGFVKQPEQSMDAEKIAWKAGGVRAVYNH